MAGLFIVIEGMDGSGKTTQINNLKRIYKGNENILFCRDPGSTQVGELIREILLSTGIKHIDPVTEAMLYASVRHELLQELIIPALDENKCVICDRFIDSSIAYQGYGKQILRETLNANKLNMAITPDYTFYIDTPKEIIDLRNYGKTKDRMEESLENDSYTSRVREGYDFLVSENMYCPHTKIDGSLKPKEIELQIFNMINMLLKERGISNTPNLKEEE